MAQLYALEFSNGKLYVGQTNGCAIKRFKAHKESMNRGVNRRVYSAWKSMGDPSLAVLFEGCISEVLHQERELINHLDLMNPSFGYNMIEGGISSPMLQREIRAKVSDTRKANKRLIEDCTERIVNVNSDAIIKSKIKLAVAESWKNPEAVSNRKNAAIASTSKRISSRGKTPCTCNGEYFATVGAAFIKHKLYHPHSAMVRQQIQKTGHCVRVYDGIEYKFKLFKGEVNV